MRYGIGEIFEQVAKAKTNVEKVKILKANDGAVIREVCKIAFDPSIEWALPETDPPFKKSELPAGMGDTNLAVEWKRMYIWIKGPKHPVMHQGKREMMFIGLLESLDCVEQSFLLNLKNKKLIGVEESIVREAFPGLLPSKSETIIKEVQEAVKEVKKKVKKVTKLKKKKEIDNAESENTPSV